MTIAVKTVSAPSIDTHQFMFAPPNTRHLPIDRSGVLDHGLRVQPASGVDNGTAYVVEIDQIVGVRQLRWSKIE